MNSGNKRNVRLSVGGSSILVILVVITLTTFATLSLVSANADSKLSQKSTQAAVEFYAADSRAEEILAQIAQEVDSVSGTGSAFYDKCEQQLSKYDGLAVSHKTGGSLDILYVVPVNDRQELSVTITVSDDQSAGLIRNRWMVINTGDFGEEDNLNLWSGDDDFIMKD